ncbi:TolC family protein [Puniceicoccus vermicola]|uniref:TolC family protein n=1 Tax=Puniceicoccus vermicola TaxID=388746 RepID=A0A7X1AV05_9BACT|nr:TolC family protein [Puniceicoccus vermicola]MBC2600447.1 TolC family protein [Puniceicoccus vermicola]
MTVSKLLPRVLPFVLLALPVGFISAQEEGGAVAEGSTLRMTDLPLPEDYYPGLRQILEKAGRQAPELVRVGIDREVAQERLRIARSRYYPSLGIGGNLGYRYVQRSGEESDGSASGSVSVGLNRPLFFWGAVEAGVEQGEIDFENSLLETKEKFQTTVQRLRDQYLELILNEMQLRNLRLRRANLETSLARRESDYRAGRLSEEEYLSYLIELDNSLIEIEELEDERNETLSSFKRISGVQEDPQIPSGVSPINLDALEAEIRGDELDPTWVEETFNIQLNRNTMEKIDLDSTIIKSRQRPNVSFSASVSQAPVNTATANDVDTIRWFAGLSVSWNVFDGFATQASRRINLLQKRRLESQIRTNIDLLEEERYKMTNDLMAMIRKQRLVERRFDLDSKIYSRVKTQYGQGRVSMNEFRSSQAEFYADEYNLHVARAALLQAIADYLVVINADRAVDYLQFSETDV